MTHTSTQWRVQQVFVDNAPDQFHVMEDKAKWGDGAIAVCDNEQHAHLIAAAPELLEALELVASMPGFEPDETYGCTVIAAIAKAKGGA